jgi:hypothetical protein
MSAGEALIAKLNRTGRVKTYNSVDYALLRAKAAASTHLTHESEAKVHRLKVRQGKNPVGMVLMGLPAYRRQHSLRKDRLGFICIDKFGLLL